MSVGLNALADASIAQIAAKENRKKVLPRRIYVALTDAKVVPEPR